MRAAALSVLVVWMLGSPQSGQAPTFRSSTDAVLVHVLVRQGARSVPDLRCDDFELRDNDVVQTLADCSYDAMPLDVALVSDISQSIDGPVLEREQVSSAQLRKLLQPIDRVRAMGFASALQTWPVERPLVIQDGTDSGHTALTDAIASALMLPADPGRRRIAFVFTDGLDSYSSVPKELVQGIVDRADTVLHVYAIANARAQWMSLDYTEPFVGDYFWFLRDLTKRGGGRFEDVKPDVDLGPLMEDAIASIRTRYLLRYIPRDVAPQGWHSIDVKVKRPGRYSISARKGYQRSQ